MKRLAYLKSVVLLFAVSTVLVGCTGNSGSKVKANEKVIKLVTSWGPKVSFYTNKNDPLKTIENLKQDEIACWGPELSDKIQAFYNAAGTNKIYGNAVQVITPGDLALAKNTPRLYLTWKSNEPRLKDAVRVVFSE